MSAWRSSGCCPRPTAIAPCRFAQAGDPFTAPSLLVEEAANVAWQRARRGEISRDQAIGAVRIVIGLVPDIVSVGDLYEDALRLAIDLDHPVYDCFYIALALRNQAPVATADGKLAALATRAGARLDPWAAATP